MYSGGVLQTGPQRWTPSALTLKTYKTRDMLQSIWAKFLHLPRAILPTGHRNSNRARGRSMLKPWRGRAASWIKPRSNHHHQRTTPSRSWASSKMPRERACCSFAWLKNQKAAVLLLASAMELDQPSSRTSPCPAGFCRLTCDSSWPSQMAAMTVSVMPSGFRAFSWKPWSTSTPVLLVLFRVKYKSKT